MIGIQIDDAYNDLFTSIDRESRRLKQLLAEQELKGEEERLKNIQVTSPVRWPAFAFSECLFLERARTREE